MSLRVCVCILAVCSANALRRYVEPTPDADLECNMRLLAYQYALDIQSYRGPAQPLTFDALQIDVYCHNQTGVTRQRYRRYKHELMKYAPPQLDSAAMLDSHVDIGAFTVYVDPSKGDDQNKGSLSSPFASLQRALECTRQQRSNALQKNIVIRAGILFLNETIVLTPDTFDNNLAIAGYPNEEVWISGGVRIAGGIENLLWSRLSGNSNNIWMAHIDSALQQQLYNHSIYGLFTETSHQRLTRARFPNGNLSVYRDNSMFIPAAETIEWSVAYGKPPNQIFKNLSCALPENGGVCLNKSAQTYYNDYTAGEGNICDIWATENFWCGNLTSGGWAFEDAYMSSDGRRQLPVGMRFNQSTANGQRIRAWKSRISDEGLVFILHDQGWCMTMNRIASASENGYDLQNAARIDFEFGGFQGSNVNRLADANAINNQPISTGPYYFDGIFDELDATQEWYFNKSTGVLYFIPDTSNGGDAAAPPNLENTGNLIIANLSTLFRLQSGSHANPLMNASLSNLKFRDARYTYMEKWGVPSGGGWALYNGGALYLTNTTNCSVSDSYFAGLDGNVIMLYGYNRNTTLSRNEFTDIGANVIAAWGYTDHWDGMAGLQPRFTHVDQNYVHNIGLYQLQSSAWFQAKSCQSFITRNIVFDEPRAAINFNDAFGGANQVTQNLLFNTCTESGDHGPINSWNRMPFLSDVAYGTPSYDAAYSDVFSNFVFANYGASQAFDTDDGSAWFNIYGNVGYNAQGYKNDYGGFNVNFYNNLNVAFGWKASNEACWNVAKTLYEGPSNVIENNTCVVFSQSGLITTIGAPTSFKGSALRLKQNAYFSMYGNVSWKIADEQGQTQMYNLSQMQSILDLEQGSSVGTIPSNEQILNWTMQLLDVQTFY